MVYKSNFGRLLSKIEGEVRGEVRVQVEALRSEAESLIMEPKSGRIYSHPKKPSPHVASSSVGGASEYGGGEPWANWTGLLRTTFSTEVRDNGLTGSFMGGGVRDPHSGSYYSTRMLEFGTSKVGPRPTFRVSLANRRGSIIQGLAAALKRGTA